MPFPGGIPVVTVTKDYRRADGTSPSVRVAFIPSSRKVVVSPSLTIEVTPVYVNVSGGLLSEVLAASVGFTYRVSETIDGRVHPAYSITTPSSGSVSLDSLAPVDPAPPVPNVTVLSVQGIKPGPDGDVELPASGGAVPTTRVVGTSTGLQGGGALTADLDISPVYGSSAGTVTEGNDARLSNARTPLAHAHVIGDVTGLSGALAALAPRKTLRQAYVTSGNIPLATGTNTWGPLSGSPTISIPAVVGDYVSLDVNAVRQPGPGNQYLDLGVVVSGQMRRYLGSGTVGTPAAQDATYEGDPALYHTAGIPSRSSSRGFVVSADDLDAGNVVFTFAVRNTGAGNPVLLASVANPLSWRAVNEGPVTVL